MSTSLASWLKSLPPILATLAESGEHAAVIMGNEACDLDSGVSSLCLAFHRAASQEKLAIPLLNIPSIDFSLKTELVAALAEEGINESSLLFRDTSPSPLNLPDFSLVLVDHNVLGEGDKALESRVTEILDHHARETHLQQAVTIEPTGSCASLVLRTILKENPGFQEASCPEVNISPKINISSRPLKMALHGTPGTPCPWCPWIVIFLHGPKKKAIFLHMVVIFLHGTPKKAFFMHT